MCDFTVAICTYNGEKRLPDVLNRLRSQAHTEQISWEIIVIDNNSKDKTAKVIQDYRSTWNNTAPIRYYLEPRQGLAFARRCAIKQARSELIGFLDDDNLPREDWVATAYKFGVEHPKAGAYGGQIVGKFEVEPPKGFERIARYFALMTGDKPYCYNQRYDGSHKKMFPPGAGIAIRKQAWLESVPKRPLLPQTNEDLEMLFYLWQRGWELWFNPEMFIEHVIPQSRFERDYLMKFFRDNGVKRYSVRMLGYQSWQQPLVLPIYAIADLGKVLVHWLKYRPVLKTDPVAAGEMELLRTILLDPFNRLKHALLERRDRVLASWQNKPSS